MSSISTAIRGVIATHGKLMTDVSKLEDSDDLYENGMTSHGTVNVMLALEDEFHVEFPDAVLRRASFQSIDSIHQLLESIGVQDAPE